jgi:hypothetical protein
LLARYVWRRAKLFLGCSAPFAPRIANGTDGKKSVGILN